jgi:aminoacylase
MVPDEELGSKKGMALFIKTPEFSKLNVGFGLDEAGACPANPFLLFNGERALWRE